MSFVRRYDGYYPGNDVISQIEGPVIVRLPPPSPINGVQQGTVGLAGEFADATYAVKVSATTGQISSNPRAVQIIVPQDVQNKLGGFDELLGNFGGEMGNGFVSLRNKAFAGLVCVPVDNITPATAGQSSYGVRFWRHLPTNQSATIPQPIVPVQAATVAAGRQFVDGGGHRVRVASAFSFGGQAAYLSGVDGSVTAGGGPAAHQTFLSAGGNFIANGVKVGDIVVLGVIGGALGLGSNAGTYRVQAVTDATHLELEMLDGSNFNWTNSPTTNLPYRIHVAATADTAGAVSSQHVAIATASGFSVPVRPIDASIAISTSLTPSVVPSTDTATAWDPLSGLTGMTSPTTGDGAGNHSVVYDANIHVNNGAGTAQLDARYTAAIDAMLSQKAPANGIKIVLASRKRATIREKIKAHVLAARAAGLTRRGICAPDLGVQATSSVIVNTEPGVGANRSEHIDYSWPYCTTTIPEAVGFALTGADGSTVLDGTLDTPFDEWLASLESNLPPENNPGQTAPPVPTLLASVTGYGRGIPDLQMNDYIALKAAGVAALFIDPGTNQPEIESGVTTSLVSSEVDIAGDRMADYIEDSIAIAMKPYSKLNQTTQLIETEFGEIVAFLEGLKSPNNPAQQRIVDYAVDPTSAQTADLTAAGITVFVVQVTLLQSQKNFVLQTSIGAGVVITNRR
jgi:hypothetical protein